MTYATGGDGRIYEKREDERKLHAVPPEPDPDLVSYRRIGLEPPTAVVALIAGVVVFALIVVVVVLS
jgi:hypothetical protein